MITLVSLSKRPIFILSFLLLTLICFLPTLAQSRSIFELEGIIDNPNLSVQSFDVVGDRLYTIFPGTYNSGDEAASFSIVDLNTLEVLDTLLLYELLNNFTSKP